jgi:hypothetical protein
MSESSYEDFGSEVDLSPKARTRPSSPVKAPRDGDDDNDELLKLLTLTQWTSVGPHIFKPVSTTYPQLHSGVYSIEDHPNLGIIFEKKSVCVDDLLRFPDSLSETILAEITTFWNRGVKFAEHGFLHRRGYMFHGPAGSGKTCLVQQIIAEIVKSEGLVFHCTGHPDIFNRGLALYRKVEPERPVICLFEDIDAIIDRWGEDAILTLLDGENQIDKVLNIATTNYPEKLDKRLIARPRRFDRVLKIGMPSKEVRKVYFKNKLNVTDAELEKWSSATEDFSFAACAELVISVCCFDKPFDDAVKVLREMMAAKVSSSDYNTTGKGFNQ